MGGISKEINDFYINFKLYNMQLKYVDTLGDSTLNRRYFTGILTVRYYLRDNQTEYFSATAGYGNAPDDFSTAYFLAENSSYKTVSCGAGYRKFFSYRTSLGITASWYNIKTNIDAYRNQYDIYISVQRRF
jgi:hypothetical protein